MVGRQFVGSNHYQSGRVAAGFVKQIIPDGSKIAIVTSSNNMSGVSQRVKAFRDVITAAYPRCTILEPIQCFDDDVIAYKALSGLLLRHDDIDLLFLAAGGYNGSFKALEDSGRLCRIKIVTFDTQELNLAQLKAGVVSAVFNQHPVHQGEFAIRLLSDYLLKHKTPDQRNYYAPTDILVAESVDDHLSYFTNNAYYQSH
jgi:LacI family transcriptional regulator